MEVPVNRINRAEEHPAFGRLQSQRKYLRYILPNLWYPDIVLARRLESDHDDTTRGLFEFPTILLTSLMFLLGLYQRRIPRNGGYC